jgi:hypothetical protein
MIYISIKGGNIQDILSDRDEVLFIADHDNFECGDKLLVEEHFSSNHLTRIRFLIRIMTVKKYEISHTFK